MQRFCDRTAALCKVRGTKTESETNHENYCFGLLKRVGRVFRLGDCEVMIPFWQFVSVYLMRSEFLGYYSEPTSERSQSENLTSQLDLTIICHCHNFQIQDKSRVTGSLSGRSLCATPMRKAIYTTACKTSTKNIFKMINPCSFSLFFVSSFCSLVQFAPLPRFPLPLCLTIPSPAMHMFHDDRPVT